MKKLFILFTILLFGVYVNAQKVTSFWGTAADTLTASVAKTQVITIGTDGYKDFSVSVFTDSVSGTPAFTAKIEYSLDGTNYFAITSAANVTHTGGLDKSLSWGGRSLYTYAAAADDTTASGTLRYYNLFIHTPVLARYLKVTLTATSAAQKSLCYGYYLITPYKD